jgi:ubiquinone/menaquinone biosynthesis C-methylase UbiE
MKHRFDPQEYLAANPDVAKAVEEGRVPSAWSHFVNFGVQEERPGVPNAIRMTAKAVMDASSKVPPANLISRVHGTSDAAGFGATGKIVALDVYAAVVPFLHMDRPLRILDFGCGCGRVLRYLLKIAPLSKIHASDVDHEAIDWCRESYQDEVRRGHCEFVVNGDAPPLPFSSDYFDLVCGISVFTHLPEKLQLQWLAELRRITKPEAFLVFSVQSDALIRGHLTPENNRILDEIGFYYFPYGSTEGLPVYYQAAWHTRSYIERVWSKYFTIIDFVPAGVAGHQDLVLCMKNPPLAI